MRLKRVVTLNLYEYSCYGIVNILTIITGLKVRQFVLNKYVQVKRAFKFTKTIYD